MVKRAGACFGCPMYQSPETAIIGPEKADIAIIGDAPTYSSAMRGKPFSGNMEKLVHTLLRSAGVKPEDVVYGTVMSCPSNKIAADEKLAREMCMPSLVQDLARRGVSKIITFGTEVSQMFIDTKDKITKLRVGPAKLSKYGFQVIPTFNPMITFRDGGKLIDLETDFNKLNTIGKKFEDFDYTVVDSLSTFNEFAAAAKKSTGPVVIDIEVGIEKDISFDHPEQYDLLCLGVALDENTAFVITDEAIEQFHAEIEQFLKSRPLIGHNIKFDLLGLRPVFGRLRAFADTMIMSYIIDERSGGHSLKTIAKELLNAPNWEEGVPQNKNFSKMDRKKMYLYNAFDVICTYRVYNIFAAHPAINHETLEFLVDKSNLLQDIEYPGFKIDLKYSDEMIEQFEESIGKKTLALRYLTGIADFNPNSPKQVKEYLAYSGIEVDSTDVAHLTMVTEHPAVPDDVKLFCKGMLNYRSDDKILSTYLKGNRDRAWKGRLYPTYLIHGTTSGRLSCRNPNLQNIPRESPIKRMFIPSYPDWVLTNTDYSQAELRVLCYLAQDKYFTDIFNQGDADVFDDLVPILYPGSVKEEMKASLWKEQRTMVKTYVYGLSYGRTAYGIAKGFNIPQALAEKHMASFWSVIPEIKEFTIQTKQKVLNGETLVTPFGRTRSFPMISKENKDNVMNEALAFTPQSTASDLCLRAASMVNNEFRERGMDARIVNLVHDAIMCDAPKDEAETVLEITKKNMLESAKMLVGDFVKFDVDSSIGANWGELK